MNILVTGAAGFVGSHLAERLADLGHAVLALDCLTDYYARGLKELNVVTLQRKGIAFLPLDLAVDDLRTAVQNVEFVYHAAAQPGLSAAVPFGTYVRNNVTATHRLIQALENASALRGFTYISTSSIYGTIATGAETSEPKPVSYYGVTKLAAEQLVLAHARNQGLPACSVRLFSVYGPRERPDKLYPRLIGCVLEDRPIPLFEGSEHHQRSYTYVHDAVDGLIGTLHHWDKCSGEIFNIGTDRSITTGEGIGIVEDIIGKRARIRRQPRRVGDQLRTQANIQKARCMLGYNPTTMPRAGLADEVEWYRQHIWGKINLWPDR